jgi:hypothetical protein
MPTMKRVPIMESVMASARTVLEEGLDDEAEAVGMMIGSEKHSES